MRRVRSVARLQKAYNESSPGSFRLFFLSPFLLAIFLVWQTCHQTQSISWVVLPGKLDGVVRPLPNTLTLIMGRTWKNFFPECVYFVAKICHRVRFPISWKKLFQSAKNIKAPVVLLWGRQILENLSLTVGITAVTVNACQ